MAQVGEVNLTSRQFEIGQLLTMGLSDKEIAHRLKIAPGTVKVMLLQARKRVGAQNRTQMALAMKNAPPAIVLPAVALPSAVKGMQTTVFVLDVIERLLERGDVDGARSLVRQAHDELKTLLQPARGE